ncbi:hypothetical protein ACRE1U_04270 [Helicobacter himalayensis]|uniref:hypothetical protein n=1 Tax=Helicobacter himalayensis TaxID=1591088 RepID=UPI003D6E0714
MKKTLLALVFGVFSTFSASSAIDLGILEISPEIGVVAGKAKVKNPIEYNPTNYGGYARVWVGTLGIVVAPQAKFDYYSKQDNKAAFSNTQYGASIGTNFGLVVLRLTPYIGANYSRFNKFFADTVAYNAGIKLKPAVLPLAVSLQYTYQNPDIIGTNSSITMHNVQLMLGLHF